MSGVALGGGRAGSLWECTNCGYTNGQYRTECQRCQRHHSVAAPYQPQHISPSAPISTTASPRAGQTLAQRYFQAPHSVVAPEITQDPVHTPLYREPLQPLHTTHAPTDPVVPPAAVYPSAGYPAADERKYNTYLQQQVPSDRPITPLASQQPKQFRYPSQQPPQASSSNPVRTPTHGRTYQQPATEVVTGDVDTLPTKGKPRAYYTDQAQTDHFASGSTPAFLPSSTGYAPTDGYGDVLPVTAAQHVHAPVYAGQEVDRSVTHAREHKFEGDLLHKLYHDPTYEPVHSTSATAVAPLVRFQPTQPTAPLGYAETTPGTPAQTLPQQQQQYQAPSALPVTQSSPYTNAQSLPSYQPLRDELIPYGRDLAEKATTVLLRYGGIYYRRHAGWSMGLFYNKLYGFLYLAIHNGEIHYELPDRIIYQTYSENEWKHWLASQSDWTLSGYELGPDFFKRGRVNRALIERAILYLQFYPIH